MKVLLGRTLLTVHTTVKKLERAKEDIIYIFSLVSDLVRAYLVTADTIENQFIVKKYVEIEGQR